jgi:hypothetical protein
VRKAFETRKAAIAQPEKRRIRHILITASNPDDGKTPPEEVTELFAQLRGKDEAQFAEIAKNRSEDAATRGQGGDLGWVTKEELPLALAEAVFAAKTPGLLDPVRTDFGWHLVWLSAIQPAQTPTFDAVAPQIRAALQQEARKRRFTELAAELPNLAFDAVDRLDPVAEKIGVPIEKTPLMPLDALTLNDGTPLPAALMAQLKSENARRGENLDPVTLPDGRMVVVRVARFEPARPRTFAEAKADAIAAWRRDHAKSGYNATIRPCRAPWWKLRLRCRANRGFGRWLQAVTPYGCSNSSRWKRRPSRKTMHAPNRLRHNCTASMVTCITVRGCARWKRAIPSRSVKRRCGNSQLNNGRDPLGQNEKGRSTRPFSLPRFAFPYKTSGSGLPSATL